MPSVILRGCWCDIIDLNAHVPTEYTIDDVKSSLCEELERAFDIFHKCYTRNLLRDFSANAVQGRLFKPTVGKDVLHEINNGNKFPVVSFVTRKNLIVTNTMLLLICCIKARNWNIQNFNFACGSIWL
jgi:hypothetical protein